MKREQMEAHAKSIGLNENDLKDGVIFMFAALMFAEGMKHAADICFERAEIQNGALGLARQSAIPGNAASQLIVDLTRAKREEADDCKALIRRRVAAVGS